MSQYTLRYLIDPKNACYYLQAFIVAGAFHVSQSSKTTDLRQALAFLEKLVDIHTFSREQNAEETLLMRHLISSAKPSLVIITLPR